MKNIKVMVADWQKVSLGYETRERNEERSQEKGGEIGYSICACCGKLIQDLDKAKHLHLIEGGSYFTEDERTINECHGADMGWWVVGPTCYSKFLKNRKEIEIVNEDEE